MKATRYIILILALLFAGISLIIPSLVTIHISPDLISIALLLTLFLWRVPVFLVRRSIPIISKWISVINLLTKSALTSFENLLERIVPLSPTQTLINQFRYESAQFYTEPISPLPFVTFQSPGDQDAHPRPALIAIMPGYAAIYPKRLLMREVITFNRDNIRWMGRVQHIEDDIREIILDVEVNYRWYSITIQIDPTRMRKLARALARLLPANLATLHSRRRPNIRSLPLEAYPTHRTLSTVIDAGQSVQLYSTPLCLVILRNDVVVAEIANEHIEDVVTLGSDCLKFSAQGHSWSFEMPEAEAFADHLARAGG